MKREMSEQVAFEIWRKDTYLHFLENCGTIVGDDDLSVGTAKKTGYGLKSRLLWLT